MTGPFERNVLLALAIAGLRKPAHKLSSLSAFGRRIDGRLLSFAEAVSRSMGLVSRLTERSLVYFVAVCVLDPNLRPLAPPFIRFENGLAEIVHN
jgi:hypothetical protein